MRAKATKNIYISDTETITTNTELEIIDGYCSTAGYYYKCITPEGSPVTINSNLLEITDCSPYVNWQNRRYEIAKVALQGILSNKALTENATNSGIVKSAVVYADLLIKELQKKV